MNCRVEVEESDKRKKGNRFVAEEGGSGHSPRDETDVPGVGRELSEVIEETVLSLSMDRLARRPSKGDSEPERGGSCRRIL
jgi:hypothetical protein